MNTKLIARFAVKVITTSCVGVVMDNAVKTTLPVSATPLNKAMAQIGGYILSAMVADKAAEYVETELAGILGQDEPVEKPKDVS